MKGVHPARHAGLVRYFPENQLGASLKAVAEGFQHTLGLDFPENHLGASLKGADREADSGEIPNFPENQLGASLKAVRTAPSTSAPT